MFYLPARPGGPGGPGGPDIADPPLSLTCPETDTETQF